MSLAVFFDQHVSNASTFIFRSLRLCVGILLWLDVCWRYGVVRLGTRYQVRGNSYVRHQNIIKTHYTLENP